MTELKVKVFNAKAPRRRKRKVKEFLNSLWPLRPRDPLHTAPQSVAEQALAVHCVIVLANSHATGSKKAPCGTSRSVRHSPARVMQRLTSAFAPEAQRLTVRH